MKADSHRQTIEHLLKSIPALERDLQCPEKEGERKRIARSLQNQTKRLERLIPFRFRLQLHNLCKQAGVSGSFIQSS
jgi:hypothetical protein